jgi:hypothetical protein
LISFKKRTKDDFIETLKDRTANIAKMVNPSDFNLSVERAIRKLNQKIYLARAIIFKKDDIVTHKNGFFINLTPYKIDEIISVTFSPTPFTESTWIDPELGLLPYISSGSAPPTSSIINYLDQLSNLNMMVRRMNSSFDWYVWPITPEGQQFLQLRNNFPMVEVKFLPYLDAKDVEWILFEDEYQLVTELSYLYLLAENARQMQSGKALGAMKESGSDLKDIQAEIKELLENWRDGSYIGAPV